MSKTRDNQKAYVRAWQLAADLFCTHQMDPIEFISHTNLILQALGQKPSCDALALIASRAPNIADVCHLPLEQAIIFGCNDARIIRFFEDASKKICGAENAPIRGGVSSTQIDASSFFVDICEVLGEHVKIASEKQLALH